MQVQALDISKFQEVPVEEALMENYSEEMEKIQEQLAELPELMAEVQQLIAEHGGMLDEVKENVLKVHESAEESVIELKAAYKEKEKSRYTLLYGGSGALGGGGIGALGFFGGPVVGTATMLASSILGFAVGTIYGSRG